jgi:peroxiredoxin
VNQVSGPETENKPGAAEPGPAPPRHSHGKLVAGAVVAVLIVVALYLVNRYWLVQVMNRQAQAKGPNAEIHPAAPDFTLTDISGQKISLADYKGKVVLLDFWATWCGPCRIEIPGFVELQNKYRDQGFSVIGISLDKGSDATGEVREFYKEFRMNYPVAVGDDKVDELYGGIVGLPTTFVIGRDGHIYSKHPGATPVSVFEEEVKPLLAAKGELTDFHPAGPVTADSQIEVSTPEEVNSPVPGVNVSKLSAAQLTKFESQLSAAKCTCGCNYNLLQCRKVDRSCGVSLKMARQQLEKFTRAGRTSL